MLHAHKNWTNGEEKRKGNAASTYCKSVIALQNLYQVHFTFGVLIFVGSISYLVSIFLTSPTLRGIRLHMLRMDDFAGLLAVLLCHIVLSSFVTTLVLAWNDEEETYESLLDMTLLLASYNCTIYCIYQLREFPVLSVVYIIG